MRDDQAEEQEILQVACQSVLLLLENTNNLPSFEIPGTNELQNDAEARKTFLRLFRKL